MAIRLFQSQTSMFCEKVRIVLALKKIPYDIADVRKDERKSLIEFTGQRKVPSARRAGCPIAIWLPHTSTTCWESCR